MSVHTVDVMQNLQKILFSKTSIVIHTVWFIVWELLHLDVNLLTLIVSLEAIYITLFIGNSQQHYLKNHLSLLPIIHDILTKVEITKEKE